MALKRSAVRTRYAPPNKARKLTACGLFFCSGKNGKLASSSLILSKSHSSSLPVELLWFVPMKGDVLLLPVTEPEEEHWLIEPSFMPMSPPVLYVPVTSPEAWLKAIGLVDGFP